MVHKLSLPVCVLISLPFGAQPGPAAAGELTAASVPEITDVHRAFLSRVVRRTLREAVLGRDVYEPGYVPSALDSLDLEVLVRLRQKGYLRAGSVGGPAPLAYSVRDAAWAAYQMLDEAGNVDLDLVNDLLVEIEVVGSAQPVPVERDWTKPRALDAYIEPGLHGMVILGPDARHRLAPTELFTNDMILSDVLEKWAMTMQSDPSQVLKTKLMRFRTVHWYQRAGDDEIVSLQRGLRLVPPDAVSPQGLDKVINALAEYMVYRQLSSGLFTYQYEPAMDRYSEDNSLVRQVGATAAMAAHASGTTSSASLAAAEMGIRYHLQGMVEIPDVMADIGDAAFIATADGQNKLGVTALLAIAMAQHPDPGRYAEAREKLINGMLWLQRPSGMFLTAFPPARKVDAQEYFPGEALLAMAMQYSIKPTARIVEAFDRSFAFYQSYFRDNPSPAFVPWQVQAYTLMAKHGKRRDYVDYVFELSDWLAARKLGPDNCPWPEMWGGIASYQDGRAGVATASYLEGFADALVLAREVGDTKRAARYEKVVRDSSRFVMQLQVKPDEAYFIRSPRDAIGGIRTAPSLNLLRIDHCQHALVALMKARRVLYP